MSWTIVALLTIGVSTLGCSTGSSIRSTPYDPAAQMAAIDAITAEPTFAGRLGMLSVDDDDRLIVPIVDMSQADADRVQSLAAVAGIEAHGIPGVVSSQDLERARSQISEALAAAGATSFAVGSDAEGDILVVVEAADEPTARDIAAQVESDFSVHVSVAIGQPGFNSN